MSGRKKGRTAAKGRLRIIGGQWRGRRLPVPDVPGLRPTPDRVRETLFNWLQADIAGLRCLDLFAGSGALGFEALSRGAGELTLLETHPAARRSLQESFRLLGITPRLPTADALQFLARDAGSYDLVFVDPPFAAGLWGAVLAALPPCLAAGHRVYVESPVSREVRLPPGWVVHKEGRAADVAFRLLAYAPESIESEPQNNGDPPPGRNE